MSISGPQMSPAVTPSSMFSSLANNAKSMNMDQINKASKDFEMVFISQMVEQMFGESEGSDAYGDEQTSDVYRSMMVDQYSQQIVGAGGIGIATQVKQELLKLQEK